jgi:hypothetical protein
MGHLHDRLQAPSGTAKCLVGAVSASAFGQGRPYRDLFLSPDRALHVCAVLKPAKHLIDGTTIIWTAPTPCRKTRGVRGWLSSGPDLPRRTAGSMP